MIARDIRSSLSKVNACLPVLILFGCLVGCGSDEHLRVSAIQLGRSLNADNTVSNFTSRFAPSDSVYVSIATAGSGSGTLSVRWMYGGRVVGEAKKPVAFRDTAATQFRLQSAARFPPGDYTVEAFLDGQSVGVRAFAVEQQR